jgi:two-component system, NarL family, sensor histidine kinase DesK
MTMDGSSVNEQNPVDGAGMAVRDGGLEEGPPYAAFYPWLLVASGAALNVLHGKTHPAWAAGGGLLVFAVLYMAAIWLKIKLNRQQAAGTVLTALGAVTIALAIGFGGAMFALFPLLSIVCGVVVPWTTRRPPWPAVIVAGAAVTGALIAWGRNASAGDIWSVLYGTVLSGFIVAMILRLISVIRELQETRQELARAAVDEERVRFARDLHDLLGHTLSVMVLKAQVTRKLATRDPELAAEQAADIERVGRQALTEVRQSVSGYRGRGIDRELDQARTALTDAGFTVIVQRDGPPLPAVPDALLGWVIREGVTNVIRHSGGHQCEIGIRHGDGRATVEIRDDGNGHPAVKLPSGGHGLGGLRERISTAGGKLEAGPRRGGGYRLLAHIPAMAGEGSISEGSTGEPRQEVVT